MNHRLRAAALGCALAALFGAAGAAGQDGAIDPDASEETRTTMRATGTFEVRLSPLDSSAPADAKIGRMSIDKTFHGDLVGSSRGEMLSGGSPAEGSAGYVAIEKVTGTLDGRRGGFLLQHFGTMTPQSQELTIEVIPGSGTHELEGIAGSMSIVREEGRHLYELEYTLPDRP